MCQWKPSHKERLFRGVLLPLEDKELRIVHMLQDYSSQHKKKNCEGKKNRVRDLERLKELSHTPSSGKCTLPSKCLA